MASAQSNASSVGGATDLSSSLQSQPVFPNPQPVYQTSQPNYAPQPNYASQPVYAPQPNYAPQPDPAAPVDYATYSSEEDSVDSLLIEKENW